jgi:hypothetical protein
MTAQRKLRLATGVALAYGGLALLWLVLELATGVRSGRVPSALLWIPIGVGLVRESTIARRVACILLGWSILVSTLPFLAMLGGPRDEIIIGAPLIGEFRSSTGVAALLIASFLALTIWQLHVLLLPEVAARFKTAAQARRGRSAG